MSQRRLGLPLSHRDGMPSRPVRGLKRSCAPSWQSKGIEHYLAIFEELRQWKDRKKVVELPLISGYVFVRFEDTDATRLKVLRTTGVVRILGAGGAIDPIPDREIESIRQALRSGNRCFAHPFVREGTWVRVRRGALAGIEGRLVRFKNQDRLVLSVELLSQAVATEVDARDVEPAREPPSARGIEDREGLCTRI